MSEAGKGEAVVKKRGGASCLLYGCVFSFLAILVLMVGGLFAGYWFVKGQVVKFTSDSPGDIPVVEYTDEEVAEVETKIETFNEAIEAGEDPGELVLTAHDVNALIAKDDDLRGRVYVSIADDQISGQVSIPTDKIPGGQGRFFNAAASFKVSLENGVLIVTLTDAEVKGEKVPQQFIDGMAQENLAKDLYKDPKVAEFIRRFEKLTVQEDRVILTPAPAKEQTAETTTEEEDTAVEAPVDAAES